MSRISACIVARNEEKWIRGCLENIKNIVDEIIVVDGRSTDNTVNICREYTDKIFQREPQGFANPDYQFAIDSANNEWILLIDADERLSDNLKAMIRGLTDQEEYNGYSFPRRNFYDENGEKWTRHVQYPDRQIRLTKKDKTKYRGMIHEFPVIDGKIKDLPDDLYMIHLVPNHYSLKTFGKHHKRYAAIQSMQMTKNRSSLFYFVKSFHIFFKIFLENMVFKKGYLDGIAGIKATFMEASYYFLVNWYMMKKK